MTSFGRIAASQIRIDANDSSPTHLLSFIHDRCTPHSRRWRDHLDRRPHLRDESGSTVSHQKVFLV